MGIYSLIKNVNIYGFDESVKASKYPMSVDIDKCTTEITNRVISLGQAETGSGHDQFLTGIIVQFDLTFSIKAWVEAERYHFLDFVSSQSTMHRISKFDPALQCNEYVDPRVIDILKEKISVYNENPSKENYLKVLYNVPAGFTLTARMTTNYRQFKTIYQQRKNHRLPEWREFCSWLETLPHSELITGEVTENEHGVA